MSDITYRIKDVTGIEVGIDPLSKAVNARVFVGKDSRKTRTITNIHMVRMEDVGISRESVSVYGMHREFVSPVTCNDELDDGIHTLRCKGEES